MRRRGRRAEARARGGARRHEAIGPRRCDNIAGTREGDARDARGAETRRRRRSRRLHRRGVARRFASRVVTGVESTAAKWTANLSLLQSPPFHKIQRSDMVSSHIRKVTFLSHSSTIPPRLFGAKHVRAGNTHHTARRVETPSRRPPPSIALVRSSRRDHPPHASRGHSRRRARALIDLSSETRKAPRLKIRFKSARTRRAL